jgi:hypothetical protein
LHSGLKEDADFGVSASWQSFLFTGIGIGVEKVGRDGEGSEEREEVREEGAFRGDDSAQTQAEAHEQCASEKESWTAHCR